jgi:hypothetical protein
MDLIVLTAFSPELNKWICIELLTDSILQLSDSGRYYSFSKHKHSGLIDFL